MSRHSATATPVTSLWASLETVTRATVRRFSVQADTSDAVAMLEHEQNRIRASSRHWLVG